MLQKLTGCVSSLTDTVVNTVKGSYHALFGVASPHAMAVRFNTNGFTFDSIEVSNVLGGYEIHLIYSDRVLHTFTLATTGTLSYWQLNPDGILVMELEVK